MKILSWHSHSFSHLFDSSLRFNLIPGNFIIPHQFSNNSTPKLLISVSWTTRMLVVFLACHQLSRTCDTHTSCILMWVGWKICRRLIKLEGNDRILYQGYLFQSIPFLVWTPHSSCSLPMQAIFWNPVTPTFFIPVTWSATMVQHVLLGLKAKSQLKQSRSVDLVKPGPHNATAFWSTQRARSAPSH